MSIPMHSCGDGTCGLYPAGINHAVGAVEQVVAVHKFVHTSRWLQLDGWFHRSSFWCAARPTLPNTGLFAVGALGCRYGEYEDLRKLVHRTLRRTERILVIGCGNSSFSAELYDDGFEEVRLAIVNSVLRATLARARARLDASCVCGGVPYSFVMCSVVSS